MWKKASINTSYELCVISLSFPHAFSSFEYSFFSVKAYINLHEAVPALSDISIRRFFKGFSLIRILGWKKVLVKHHNAFNYLRLSPTPVRKSEKAYIFPVLLELNLTLKSKL